MKRLCKRIRRKLMVWLARGDMVILNAYCKNIVIRDSSRNIKSGEIGFKHSEQLGYIANSFFEITGKNDLPFRLNVTDEGPGYIE